jgi:hypothetical protein
VEKIILTKESETKAMELGATRSAIKKWRVRGVPFRWQVRLGLLVQVIAPAGHFEVSQ